MTLADFLLARIAEDEADANADLVAERDGQIHAAWGANAERVLAECEAKRRIVEMHSAYEHPQRMVYGSIIACEVCGSVDDSPVEWPCDTLKALAAVYADHPDCREEWRP